MQMNRQQRKNRTRLRSFEPVTDWAEGRRVFATDRRDAVTKEREKGSETISRTCLQPEKYPEEIREGRQRKSRCCSTGKEGFETTKIRFCSAREEGIETRKREIVSDLQSVGDPNEKGSINSEEIEGRSYRIRRRESRSSGARTCREQKSTEGLHSQFYYIAFSRISYPVLLLKSTE
ncbi:hypothetical protein L2E82_35524 [Cichorium intybus]|uniref:Uncharacterized protein n=1 Tax=Cichorium intybus TaxID=13427 RepID=A0ACB9BP04_CICIN|nr:hypothetical protein L2E82_35524 [Cichorium intybus]